ncbi:MAG TPA: zinc metallopeptidase [Thermoanaerobaculia bacterium]|nr:zinc metallopeptidase [Thermoanaerobaculia bacterium]HXT51104.1 zinc metallopeptidase [Thermoanaerobaculia bacterium]
MFFDPMYLLFIAPALALSLWASWRTRSAFNKYSRVRTARGLTGAQAARILLDTAGLNDVEIVPAQGFLSDHYNPMTRKLALSEAVYGSPSVAAVGVACHEAGHALQHSQHYGPLWLRTALVPTANIGSKFGYFGMLFGLILHVQGLFLVGALLFAAVVFFQLVTLPVEYDASNRAKKLAFEHGLVFDQERVGMAKVLDAAALTYVAAAISSLMTLLYFLLRSGLLGGRRG